MEVDTHAIYGKKACWVLTTPQLQLWSEGQSRLHKSIHPQSRLTTLPGSDYLTLYYNSKSVANTVLSMVNEWRKEYRLVA